MSTTILVLTTPTEIMNRFLTILDNMDSLFDASVLEPLFDGQDITFAVLDEKDGCSFGRHSAYGNIIGRG